MKHSWIGVIGLILLGIITIGITQGEAATSAAGPYYAIPSWDQTFPTSTRFIILTNMNSDAVLDRETGLVWAVHPSTDEVTWSTANMRCISATTGGKMGWRLPTVQELSSLVDKSKVLPALPSGHPFIIDTPYFDAWSSTSSSFACDTNCAWHVWFKDGNAFSLHKDLQLNVWCVRGGQGSDFQ